jgi:surfactin synthase thioesterase subunit
VIDVRRRPASPAQRWLRIYRPRPRARLRLVCLPHAGGNANTYRPFIAALPPDIELISVQYPGRLDRSGESWPENIQAVTGELVVALAGFRDRPLALFGHSMGAMLAHEIARRLEAVGDDVDHLMVSGRPAPNRIRETANHRLSDDALWAEIGRLGGTPAELLEHEELRAYILPSLRNDYRLAETHRLTPGPLLRCPVTAMTGNADSEVTLDEARSWSQVTTGPFRLLIFPGDHFYLSARPPDIVRAWADALGPAQQRGAR